MAGKKLTAKRKSIINICYLIDVSPEKFCGGGQAHLTNLIRQMRVQSSKFKVQSFGGPSPNTQVRFLWSIWVIPQVIFYHFFRKKFSLIHAHSIPAMAAGKILSVILKIPIVVTVHGSNMLDLSGQSSRAKRGDLIGKKIATSMTPRNDRIFMFKYLIEKFVLTKIKCDVQITVARNFLEYPNTNQPVYIPNGVDVAKYVQGRQTSKGPTFQTATLCKGRTLMGKTILFVGRKNDPVKGFAILEKAMEMVKEEIPNAELLVMDGSYSQDEVIKAYHKVDLFVLPSLSEGFPLTLLEAWAAKLPVVASAVGEIPYLMTGSLPAEASAQEGHPSMAEYLVEPGNSIKLANTIIRALKNNNLAKIGENGYNVARRFKWESVARETMKIYKSLIINPLTY